MLACKKGGRRRCVTLVNVLLLCRRALLELAVRGVGRDHKVDELKRNPGHMSIGMKGGACKEWAYLTGR